MYWAATGVIIGYYSIETGPTGASTGPSFVTGPTYGNALVPSGDASGYSVSANAFYSSSDFRIKENIKIIDLYEYTIDNLKPCHYYNSQLFKEDFGFIADEVQEIFPFLVNGNKNGSMYQSISYNSFIALLVKEIQELKKKVSQLSSIINSK